MCSTVLCMEKSRILAVTCDWNISFLIFIILLKLSHNFPIGKTREMSHNWVALNFLFKYKERNRKGPDTIDNTYTPSLNKGQPERHLVRSLESHSNVNGKETLNFKILEKCTLLEERKNQQLENCTQILSVCTFLLQPKIILGTKKKPHKFLFTSKIL